ncbi:MAG: hypothetical protein HY814_13320 [Candidatus Riflebacteria bacterium]|nr:hypothetical protein [Candidatus Riflebacteria bacterium]
MPKVSAVRLWIDSEPRLARVFARLGDGDRVSLGRTPTCWAGALPSRPTRLSISILQDGYRAEEVGVMVGPGARPKPITVKLTPAARQGKRPEVLRVLFDKSRAERLRYRLVRLGRGLPTGTTISLGLLSEEAGTSAFLLGPIPGGQISKSSLTSRACRQWMEANLRARPSRASTSEWTCLSSHPPGQYALVLASQDWGPESVELKLGYPRPLEPVRVSVPFEEVHVPQVRCRPFDLPEGLPAGTLLTLRPRFPVAPETVLLRHGPLPGTDLTPDGLQPAVCREWMQQSLVETVASDDRTTWEVRQPLGPGRYALAVWTASAAPGEVLLEIVRP